MNMMKKPIPLLLCIAVLLLFAGCAPTETQTTAVSTTLPTTTTTEASMQATVSQTASSTNEAVTATQEAASQKTDKETEKAANEKTTAKATTQTSTEKTTNKATNKNERPETAKSLKILSVGNSLSRDGMNYLPQLLKEAGYTKVVIAYLYVGGCSLEEHVENAVSGKKAYEYYENTGTGWECEKNRSLKYGLGAQEWDYVTLQQASRLSGVSGSYKYLDELIDFVLKNAKGAPELLWHMTWAYEEDCDLEFFERYDRNQLKMYNDTIACIREHILTNRNIRGVIPVGTAVQNARSTFIGSSVTEDGRHMSKPLGRYLASLTWFGYLTDSDVTGVKFNPNSEKLDQKTVRAIKNSVNKALKNPF